MKVRGVLITGRPNAAGYKEYMNDMKDLLSTKSFSTQRKIQVLKSIFPLLLELNQKTAHDLDLINILLGCFNEDFNEDETNAR